MNANIERNVYTDLFDHEQLTLRWGFYNHALGQVTYLFNKEILCIQRHAVMFVQVYANPSLVNGLWIFRNGRSGVMSIDKKVIEVRIIV